MKIIYGIDPDLCINNPELITNFYQDVLLPEYFYTQLKYLQNSNFEFATHAATKILDSLKKDTESNLLIFQTLNKGSVYFINQENYLHHLDNNHENIDIRNPFNRYLLTLDKLAKTIKAKVLFFALSYPVIIKIQTLGFEIISQKEYLTFGESWLKENILEIEAKLNPIYQMEWQEDSQPVQHISGHNLAEELAEGGTFTEAQIRQLLKQLLLALQTIHTKNIIHGDIKPENIIRRHPDGELFLVNINPLKIVSDTSLHSEYTAPEQINNKAVFASDLYSLGVTCIHLLTQIEPFYLFSRVEWAWVWQDYLINNSLSKKLVYILNKMIEPEINKRYQSTAEILAELNPNSQIKWQEKIYTQPDKIYWRDIKR